MENIAKLLIGIGLLIIFITILYYLALWGNKRSIIANTKQEAENKAKREFYENTRNNYFNSLNELKSNPTNADVKQHTLHYGREYSALTRKYQGQDKTVTIYDEMALMNDINAACAGATVIHSQSIEERLSKLFELKDKNLISEQEYQQKRHKILDEI